MFRKDRKPPRTASEKDVIAFKQDLRARIWYIIAKNNAEVLTDPNARPLENSMPYVERAEQTPVSSDAGKPKSDADKPKQEDDVKTLDEIMPLPEKKKAKKASELISPSKDKNQINMDEAIAASPDAQSQAQTSEAKAEEEKQANEQKSEEPANEQKSQSDSQHGDSAEQHKKTFTEVVQDYLKERRARLERRDYFKALDLQIKNKNAVCYEILDLLDE